MPLPRSRRREGERYGGGGIPSLSPRHPTMGSMGSVLSGVRGFGEWILCVLSSTKRISDGQKCQNDQLHFDQLLELLDGKSGQIRDRVRNSGQFSVPNDLVFFSGQALKIRDCPEKFATDGHLMFI